MNVIVQVISLCSVEAIAQASFETLELEMELGVGVSQTYEGIAKGV